MAFWQAVLIGLIGFASSIYGTWFFGTIGGWNMTGRPLIAGMIIGLILGDVQKGIIVGAAIQALYIGLITPGLSVPGDVNFASYIGIPLTLVAAAQPEYAVMLSVPLSFLGVALIYLVVSVNVVFVHWQDRAIEEGNLKLATNIPIIACITQFICRFFPIFLACYFGAEYVDKLINLIPENIGNIFLVLGGILPAIGFGMLLQYTIKQNKDLLFMIVGFMLIAVFNITIVPVVLIALFIAVTNLDKSFFKKGA